MTEKSGSDSDDPSVLFPVHKLIPSSHAAPFYQTMSIVQASGGYCGTSKIVFRPLFSELGSRFISPGIYTLLVSLSFMSTRVKAKDWSLHKLVQYCRDCDLANTQVLRVKFEITQLGFDVQFIPEWDQCLLGATRIHHAPDVNCLCLTPSYQ
jgi:hypothetical protein